MAFFSLIATIPGHSHATSLLIGRDFRYVVAMASCFVYASNAPSLHYREPPPPQKVQIGSYLPLAANNLLLKTTTTTAALLLFYFVFIEPFIVFQKITFAIP